MNTKSLSDQIDDDDNVPWDANQPWPPVFVEKRNQDFETGWNPKTRCLDVCVSAVVWCEPEPGDKRSIYLETDFGGIVLYLGSQEMKTLLFAMMEEVLLT